jgi:hypothetical protein
MAADHPMAAWLFKKFKTDRFIMGKKEAYEIGNELNRQLDRIEDLEQRLGIPKEKPEDGDDYYDNLPF